MFLTLQQDGCFPSPFAVETSPAVFLCCTLHGLRGAPSNVLECVSFVMLTISSEASPFWDTRKGQLKILLNSRPWKRNSCVPKTVSKFRHDQEKMHLLEGRLQKPGSVTFPSTSLFCLVGSWGRLPSQHFSNTKEARKTNSDYFRVCGQTSLKSCDSVLLYCPAANLFLEAAASQTDFPWFLALNQCHLLTAVAGDLRWLSRCGTPSLLCEEKTKTK